MNKYIIYKGSGGLVHLLGGLVYCCNYVKNKKNYLLVIDIKNHQAFGNYFKKYFELNNIKYTEDYNDIINMSDYYKIKLKEFEKKNVEYLNKFGYIFKHNDNILNIGNSLEKINYYNNIKFYAGNGGNDLNNIIKYVKCNNKVKEELKKYNINGKYVGVHFRNTDRNNDINKFIQNLKKYKDYKIYIATDDINALNKFKLELKDYNLIYFFEPYDTKGENIHFNNPDKDVVIMSIIIDMYILYKSHIFINSPNSLVSKLVNRMRISNKSIFE